MKFKDKLVKIVLILLLGSVAINLSSIAMDNAVIHPTLENEVSTLAGPIKIHSQPSVLAGVTSNEVSVFGQTKSNLLGYLFQIIFILFFISPPIMALMLFLIWKELKERNKMK